MKQPTPFDSTHISKKQQITSPRDTISMAMQDQIRLRAYELYEQRGRLDGHHQEDWIQAEQEVHDKFGLGKAA